MKRKVLEKELKREVSNMLPENMVNEIKAQEVTPKRVINKNISVIQERNKKSIIPIIASCVESFVICLAVFLPLEIQNEKDYNNWVASQNQETQQEVEIEDNEEK